MNDRRYDHKFETAVDVNSSPQQLFAELDDQERLSAHMMASSAMMAGNRMRFESDEGHGQAVGARIRMTGEILGFHLELEEIVTERVPPERKVWETIGQPRLLVIGDYRMGFQIGHHVMGSRLTVFIDYNEPSQPWTWLGKILGPMYARWCTVNMARGAAKRFTPSLAQRR
jgi:hypothetical protein